MNDIKSYLGVDWGTSRIGLAVGDNHVKVATPFKTVINLNELLKVASREDVAEIIVGRPIKMSGDKKNLTPEFLEFEEKIKKSALCPIKFIDERLTSKAGDKFIGNKKTKASRDEIAATIILQDYLDSI